MKEYLVIMDLILKVAALVFSFYHYFGERYELAIFWLLMSMACELSTIRKNTDPE